MEKIFRKGLRGMPEYVIINDRQTDRQTDRQLIYKRLSFCRAFFHSVFKVKAAGGGDFLAGILCPVGCPVSGGYLRLKKLYEKQWEGYGYEIC